MPIKIFYTEELTEQEDKVLENLFVNEVIEFEEYIFDQKSGLPLPVKRPKK